MSVMHDDVAPFLGFLLQSQLDRDAVRVQVNGARIRYTARNYVNPDAAVIPASLVLSRRRDLAAVNDYVDPLPLVIEIWSRTTGAYALAAKLPAYRQRGDREIWFLHPIEPTLAARRKQPDGSYHEAHYTGGIVPVLSLPGVAIDLDALFDI